MCGSAYAILLLRVTLAFAPVGFLNNLSRDGWDRSTRFRPRCDTTCLATLRSVLGIGRGLALCFTRLRTLPLVQNVVPVPRVPATGNSNLHIGSLAPINASAPTNSPPQRGCKRDSRAAIYSVADGSYNVGHEGLPTCAFAVRARSLPPFGRTLQRSPPGCGRIFRVPDPDRKKAARRRASVGSAAHKSQKTGCA
jgi:hypothetical protein